MNDWMNLSGGVDMRSGIPVTLTDGKWEQHKRHNAFPDIHQARTKSFNEKFHDSYSDLTSKIAYRYPNPGLPRLRQGSIGGSWRHIKEVLGHGGSRVIYVDGLVGVYDQENFNQSLQSQLPYRPHMRRVLYSANRGHLPDAVPKRQTVGMTGQTPAVEELPMMSENERLRKLAIQSPTKHKGVYKYNQRNANATM